MVQLASATHGSGSGSGSIHGGGVLHTFFGVLFGVLVFFGTLLIRLFGLLFLPVHEHPLLPPILRPRNEAASLKAKKANKTANKITTRMMIG